VKNLGLLIIHVLNLAFLKHEITPKTDNQSQLLPNVHEEVWSSASSDSHIFIHEKGERHVHAIGSIDQMSGANEDLFNDSPRS
jgi:hypothetical protein